MIYLIFKVPLVQQQNFCSDVFITNLQALFGSLHCLDVNIVGHAIY